METSRRGPRAFLALLASVAAWSATAWASPPQVPIHPAPIVVSDGHNRIADPKLSGGGVRASFHLQSPAGM